MWRAAILAVLLLTPTAAHATGPLCCGGADSGTSAPDDATYILQTPDPDLPNAQDLDSLAAGLLLNDSSGVLSTYAGSSCSASQAPRGLNASGAVQNCTTFLTAEVDGSTTNEIQNIFETFNAPSGTDPVADSATDTLNLAAGGIVTISGDSSTDTITISATEVDGSTTNELQSLFETVSTSSGTNPVADSTTDTLALSGTAPVTVTGNSGTDTITFSLADVTDCSANQFVTGSGANLSLVCAQPSAANLSNGTTGSGAVVLANSPTIVTPTIASFVNATHDHSNSAGGGQITHADLGSKGADDHTQYALLAGRSGGQILIGGTASGDDLTLQSTSNGTKGTIILDDLTDLWPSVPNVTASTSATTTLLTTSADLDVGGIAKNFHMMRMAPQVHIGQESSLFGTIAVVSTEGMSILHDDATAATSSLPFSQLLWAAHEITTTVAIGAPAQYTLLDSTRVTASGSITVPSGNGALLTIRSTPAVKAISGATFTYPEVTGLYFQPSISTDNASSDGTAVTVTSMYGARFLDYTTAGDGTETVGTYVALDVAALANATTNIGFRNADTTVFTPPSTVTLAAAFTLTATATTQKVNATANRTSDTTTAIVDGVADGQEFVVMNVDAEGQTVTIKNNANTDLGADCTLNQGGTLTVVWSSDLSAWLTRGCAAS